ncbi:MAG: hypothetical protein M9900_07920 [Flavobacteriales bacterium]|nr:hypothetical protein [Flavobacteriales bacterium]
MMERMRGPWGFARLLRLGLAVAFLWAAIDGGEAVAWFAAVFFGVQATFSMGCCGSTCAPAPNQAKKQGVEEVHYEEVR